MASPTILGKATSVGSGGVNFTNSNYDVPPVAGNLLVAFIGMNGYSYNFDVPALYGIVIPSGWTEIGFTLYGNEGLAAVFYKIATGSDNVNFSGLSGDGQPESAGVIVSIGNGGTPSINYGQFMSTPAIIGGIGSSSDLLLVSAIQVHGGGGGVTPSIPTGMNNLAYANCYGIATNDTTAVQVSSLVPQGTPLGHSSNFTGGVAAMSAVSIPYSTGVTQVTNKVGWGVLLG
jgi:hypothetical protein